jgi:hypothetical protein
MRDVYLKPTPSSLQVTARSFSSPYFVREFGMTEIHIKLGLFQ